MPKQVNVTEARPHLSHLLREVALGEEIVISKAGKPIARLVPYQPSREPRKPGSWEGQYWLADDWDSDEVNKEIEDLFYNSEIEPSE